MPDPQPTYTPSEEDIDYRIELADLADSILQHQNDDCPVEDDAD